MTRPVSEAAKAKACELFEAGCREIGVTARWLPKDADTFGNVRAFARFIQQVSDAAKESTVRAESCAVRLELLAPFILPDPVDPLQEALAAASIATSCGPMEGASRLRAELAARGLKIVEDSK